MLWWHFFALFVNASQFSKRVALRNLQFCNEGILPFRIDKIVSALHNFGEGSGSTHLGASIFTGHHIRSAVWRDGDTDNLFSGISRG